MYTFVTGGLQSGKSAYALRRASELGPPPWLYVAVGAASAGDEELQKRLHKNRRDEEAIWKVLEAPSQIGSLFEPSRIGGHGAMVLDGFTKWLGARLDKAPDKATRSDGAATSQALRAEVEDLADRMYRSPIPVVCITTEIGLGLTPSGPADRGFLDLAGIANQILAERAESVVMMVSGIPLRLR